MFTYFDSSGSVNKTIKYYNLSLSNVIQSLPKHLSQYSSSISNTFRIWHKVNKIFSFTIRYKMAEDNAHIQEAVQKVDVGS